MSKLFVIALCLACIVKAMCWNMLKYKSEDSDEDWGEPLPIEYVNCTGLESNYYVLGCSPKYTRCFKYGIWKSECGPGLFFNPETRSCSEKDMVKACRDPEASRGKIIAAHEIFSCIGRANGNYSHPFNTCDQLYFACENEKVERYYCYLDERFNVLNHRCDRTANVQACSDENSDTSNNRLPSVPSIQNQMIGVTPQPSQFSNPPSLSYLNQNRPAPE